MLSYSITYAAEINTASVHLTIREAFLRLCSESPSSHSGKPIARWTLLSRQPYLWSCGGRGLPYRAIIAFTSLIPLVYINKNDRITNFWRYISQVSSTTGIIARLVILVTYPRLCHDIGFWNIKRKELQYKALFQTYTTYFGSAYRKLSLRA